MAHRWPVLLALVLIASLTSISAAAQSATPAASDPGRNPVIWSVVGGGVGFGAGMLVGLAKFDDAIYAERKILTTSLLFAAGGAVAGALLSRQFSSRSSDVLSRDPLWNGMLAGALGGAAVGMWYIPAANCKTDINPECPRALRLAVGIPAVAGGAALGALIDRLVGPRRSSPAPAVRAMMVAPIVGPRAIGVHVSRSF